jgi:hypothetical protein
MVKEKRMKFFVLATFFVVGAWTGAAHGSVTIPADTKIIVVESKTCRDSVYYKGTNTMYVYDCTSKGRVATATDRVVNRSIDRTARTVERSIQHGIDRQIYEMGRKIDKALGRF